jgi:hypothetical protein
MGRGIPKLRLAAMSAQDYSALQTVLDQLIAFDCKRRSKNGTAFSVGKKVVVSAEETNDIHIDINRISIHPFYLTLGHAGDPLKVVARAIDLSIEFDEERKRRTQHAINHLRWQLRLTLKQLSELDPNSAKEIVMEYLGGYETDDDGPADLDLIEVPNV